MHAGWFIVLIISVGPVCAVAQSIGPRGIVGSGGHGAFATGHLSWSVGQISGASYTSSNELLTAGIQQPDVILLQLNIRAFLGGAYNSVNGWMNDGLRSAGLIPATEPYSAQPGFTHAGIGGGEQVFPGALIVSGQDAIVDWLFIELRDAADPQIVRSTRAALVQRDGDVVDTDGISAVRISALPGAHYLAIRHRNHLPVMSNTPIMLGFSTSVDITNGSVAVYGTNAQQNKNGVDMLWPGDVLGDHVVRYVGTMNDRDPILQGVGGTVPTMVQTGYLPTDVNMDGVTKYAGANNDRDPVLITIGGTIPTAVRNAQFP